MSSDERTGLEQLLAELCKDIAENSDRLSRQVYASILVIRGALSSAPIGMDALCKVLGEFSEKELARIRREKETLKARIKELQDEI